MKNLKTIPYVLLLASIFIGTLNGMFANISFVSYLERTFVFYAIIFFGSHICTSTIIKVNLSRVHNEKHKIDLVIPSDKSELLDNAKEEQDFIPLDFRSYDEVRHSKISEHMNES